MHSLTRSFSVFSVAAIAGLENMQVKRLVVPLKLRQGALDIWQLQEQRARRPGGWRRGQCMSGVGELLL